MRLKDNVAIVTGAAQGIGLAVAQAMAKEGACVVAADLNSEGAAKVAANIKKSGGRALAVKVDISKESEVEEMVKKTIAEFGRVDILASIAAYTAVKFKPFQENTAKDWEPHIEVTLKGSLFCAKAVIPFMIKQGGGRIINMASDYGKVGMPYLAIYSATKAAVPGYTRAIAQELAPLGITVNCVSASAVDTPALSGGLGTAVAALPPEQILAAIPMKRIGKPEEIAGMFVFLASDEASFITGQDYSVDGGMRM